MVTRGGWLGVASMACATTLIGSHRTDAQTAPGSGNEVAVEVGYVYFDVLFDPWQHAALSYARRSAFGTLIARGNYARRFGESGLQFEVDAYPTFGRGVYAYLSVGYSPLGAFPRWRSGGELFTSLPLAMEASAGFRHMQFGEGVTIWTGSVGKYHGNSWHAVRPFLRSSQGDLSWTILVMTRRYFVDADNYVGVLLGYGSTPGEIATERDLERENDLKAEVTGKHPLGARLHWQWRVSLEREELTLARVRYRFGATLRFERTF